MSRTLLRHLFEEESLGEDWLYENLDGQSEYQDRCFDFIVQNWDKEIDFLTPRQMRWANEILEDCVEKKIKGKKIPTWKFREFR